MILGIASAIARISIVFIGIFAGINVVGGGLSQQSTNEFMANLIVIISVIAPYLIGVGVASIFLYVFLFPDRESRATVIFWGIIMMLYLLALIFIPGL